MGEFEKRILQKAVKGDIHYLPFPLVHLPKGVVEEVVAEMRREFPKETLAIFRNIAYAHKHGQETIYRMRSREIVEVIEFWEKWLEEDSEK